MSDLDAIRAHPRLAGVGRSAREQERLLRFARDLAGWLAGSGESMEPLARVVTRVAQRELRDPRQLCAERPLLAVEAAARAAEALWPLLRGPLEPDPPTEGAPQRGGGEDGAGGGDRGEGGDQAGGGDGPGRGGGGAGAGRPRSTGGGGDEDEDEDGDSRSAGAGGADGGDGGEGEDGEDGADDADGEDGGGDGSAGDGTAESADSADSTDSEDSAHNERSADGESTAESAQNAERDGGGGEDSADSASSNGASEADSAARAGGGDAARPPRPRAGEGRAHEPRPRGTAEPAKDPQDLESLLAELSSDPEARALAERLIAAFDADRSEAAEQAAQNAVTGALEAERVARHLERFLPGIGWSTAPGALDHMLLERLDGLAGLIERLDSLRELADAIGRVEEASRREGHRAGGGEEVVGVHFGGEVAQALPAELALLGDPATEDLFYQRLLERRLLSLELTGAGIDGSAAGDRRGPVIACIDTSGSMEGAPELAAKALVLAVCRRVLPQKRTVHLILFGAPGELTELRLRRGLGGLEALIDFLGLSFSSGTDFDTPLLRAIELLDERDLRDADVLVVTDGLCRATAQMVEQVQRVRVSRGVRVRSVVLGPAATGGVAPFSDEVWQLEPEDAAQAVGLIRRF